MILVDIGNTTLHFAIEKDNKIVKDFRIYNKDWHKEHLYKILRDYPNSKFILCSVVPSFTAFFKKVLKSKLLVVGEDIKTPIKCLYNKNDVGQDRLVNVYSALVFYPKARIVIDFGTAITIDFISSQGVYLGGFILPGINLYLDSLKRCALLANRIRLVKSRVVIPKNTQSSISQGLYEGFSFMINGFIEKYGKLLYRGNYRVVVTGGESPLLLKRLNFPFIYEPSLILKGFLLLKNCCKR
ncbi:MAG: type III pantothenate kinase [Candidatus Omnitrophica bacterium]|nr:type III pantothenate kinase [Candidatus Omnitrophota bacterium]